MTEETREVTDEMVAPTEKELLMRQARSLGIKVHPSISVAKLKIKIETSMGETLDPTKQDFVGDRAGKSKRDVKNMCRTLKRIQLTCNDPMKTNYPGEYFATANAVSGVLKRFIPYHGKPWHCEAMILNFLKDKQYTKFTIHKNPITGDEYTKANDAPMYTIIELPALTAAEVKQLAKEQKASNRIEL